MALTATKDLMLPATVTGSWPRPRWYTMGMWGRPLDTAMMDPWFREQFTDAHAVVVSDQARAGLDIVTTGDYHLDEDVAGRSWHHYMLQRWKGFEHEELQSEKTRSPLLSYPVGTMLDSIYKTWRWPRVNGKVEHDPKNPLEYAKIWRIAQQAAAASRRPVKFGTCSAQVLAFFLDSHTPQYDLDDKKQLIWDMAEAMNRELRQLAASGCKVIQVEEPTLHFMARYSPDQKELINFLVDAFNREVEGLENVEVWIHTCWGNPNMQKVFSDESYANSIEIYLERLTFASPSCPIPANLPMRTWPLSGANSFTPRATIANAAAPSTRSSSTASTTPPAASPTAGSASSAASTKPTPTSSWKQFAPTFACSRPQCNSAGLPSGTLYPADRTLLASTTATRVEPSLRWK